MSVEDIELVVRAMQDRYLGAAKDDCVKYVSIFQNHGKTAGASISHPHFQLIAIPVIPPDVNRSLHGSQKYYEEHQKCVHCVMLEYSYANRQRVVYENEHFLAETPFASKTAFEINVGGTVNVAHLARKYHIPLVYASTGSVYMPIEQKPPINETFPARGNSVYGITKYLGEIYVREVSSPWIILRYAHLYGKEKRMHGLIGGFLERIQRGMAPTLYGGRQSNDFTYIKDIAGANFAALIAPWDKWGQVYNIGTGQEITAEEAGKTICRITGYKGRIEKKEMRTVDPMRFSFDCSKAERMLGFKAFYSFENGLKDMFGKL